MYYKIRKKYIRFIQTLKGDNISMNQERWSPKYKLEYLKLYRHYVKTLQMEVTYE